MATTISAASPFKTLGVDFNESHTTPEHDLGIILFDAVGRGLRYVKAGEAIAADGLVKYTAAFAATNSGNGERIDGVSPAALAENAYGWVVISGEVSAEAATGFDTGEFGAAIADADGRIQPIDNDSTTDGLGHIRAVALGDEASNVTLVRLV